MPADLGKVFQDLVVAVDVEQNMEQILSLACDAPNDKTSLDFETGPVPPVRKSRSAEVGGGAGRPVTLFLLQDRAGVVPTSITVELERTGAVFDGNPIREDKSRGFTELFQKSLDEHFHIPCEGERYTRFQ